MKKEKQTQNWDTLAKLQKISILPWRPNLPKTKKVQDQFEFLQYVGYITFIKAGLFFVM